MNLPNATDKNIPIVGYCPEYKPATHYAEKLTADELMDEEQKQRDYLASGWDEVLESAGL